MINYTVNKIVVFLVQFLAIFIHNAGRNISYNLIIKKNTIIFLLFLWPIKILISIQQDVIRKNYKLILDFGRKSCAISYKAAHWQWKIFSFGFSCLTQRIHDESAARRHLAYVVLRWRCFELTFNHTALSQRQKRESESLPWNSTVTCAIKMCANGCNSVRQLHPLVR